MNDTPEHARGRDRADALGQRRPTAIPPNLGAAMHAVEVRRLKLLLDASRSTASLLALIAANPALPARRSA